MLSNIAEAFLREAAGEGHELDSGHTLPCPSQSTPSHKCPMKLSIHGTYLPVATVVYKHSADLCQDSTILEPSTTLQRARFTTVMRTVCSRDTAMTQVVLMQLDLGPLDFP